MSQLDKLPLGDLQQIAQKLRNSPVSLKKDGTTTARGLIKACFEEVSEDNLTPLLEFLQKYGLGSREEILDLLSQPEEIESIEKRDYTPDEVRKYRNSFVVNLKLVSFEITDPLYFQNMEEKLRKEGIFSFNEDGTILFQLPNKQGQTEVYPLSLAKLNNRKENIKIIVDPQVNSQRIHQLLTLLGQYLKVSEKESIALLMYLIGLPHTLMNLYIGSDNSVMYEYASIFTLLDGKDYRPFRSYKNLLENSYTLQCL